MSVRLSRRLPRGRAVALPVASGRRRAKVYVILWFDTEDYILPADDDAALHLANFLTDEEFGPRSRSSARRPAPWSAQRDDVIAALKKHEIGFHSNWHSVQPSPAMYLSTLGWDEGWPSSTGARARAATTWNASSVRRRPATVSRAARGPQSYGAMKKWGMGVYLDAGKHIGLDGKPCYYDGALNLYNLDHILRTDLTSLETEQPAEDKFTEAHKALLAEGGGMVSIYYHPCEFVHKEFWDGVNFSQGRQPAARTVEAAAAKDARRDEDGLRVFRDLDSLHPALPRSAIHHGVGGGQAVPRPVARLPFAPDNQAMAAAVGDEITSSGTRKLHRRQAVTSVRRRGVRLLNRLCGHGGLPASRPGAGGDRPAVRPDQRIAGNRGRNGVDDRLEPVRPHRRGRGRFSRQGGTGAGDGLARLEAGATGGVSAGAWPVWSRTWSTARSRRRRSKSSRRCWPRRNTSPPTTRSCGAG